MSWKNIFARKELDVLLAEMAGEHRLRRVLGPIALTSLGVGAIIGAGIFVLTGMAAAENAGPAVMVSFGIAAVGCVFAALCYAEFAAMAPVAGSVYAYTYTTLGEIFAWIIGWDLILEYSMGCAAVASAWASHLNELIGSVSTLCGAKQPWGIPARLCLDPFSTISGDSTVHGIFNLPAVIIMILVTTVLVIGIRESARTNATLVMIKLFVVLFVIGVGMAYIDSANWTSIPVTARVLPEEREIPDLVEKHFADDASVTKQQKAAVVRQVAAAYRLQWAHEELDHRHDTGELADADYQSAVAAIVAEAQAAGGDGDPQVADQETVEELIKAVRAKGEDKATHSWGLLGIVGLNRWLQPIDDATRSPFTPYGLSGVMLGAAIVFFAFIGFDSISTHAEEARNPQRDVPIGIISSLVLCTVLYIAVAAVVTGMMPYPQIDIHAAIAAAFSHRAEVDQSNLLRASTALIAAGGLAGMTSVLLVLFLSQARVFMAMARDGLLPRVFSTVHPRWRTPHVATMLTGAVICVVAALTPIRKLGEMVNIGTLMAFVMVCAAVLILRVRRPEVHRPFRCPVVKLVAPLGIVTNLVLMLFLPVDTWLRLVVWLAIGLYVYFHYSRWHSVLGNHLVRQLKYEGVTPTDAPLDSVGD